jgi:hypothetical protein
VYGNFHTVMPQQALVVGNIDTFLQKMLGITVVPSENTAHFPDSGLSLAIASTFWLLEVQ